MTTTKNFELYVAAYSDVDAAMEDFATIKSLEDAAVVAAVVLQRDAKGNVTVKEHGGSLVKGGTAVGAVAGFVVGLFAPPLLIATAVGAGVGAAVGAITKHHEEKKAGEEFETEDWLPDNSSALVAVIDDKYLDRVDKVVSRANKQIHKAIDSGDYDAVVKAINEGGQQIVDAVDRS